VASLAGASADEIADGVLTAVTDFQGGRLRDDVALLVVRVDP
jgi:serine phosphatase RsbU (regulator of sigma subunit)